MTDTITYTGTLVTEECPACFMHFGMPADFQRRRRDDHKSFHCPAGHSMSYGGQTEAEKLRAQLERTQQHLRNTQAARDAAQDQAQTAEYRRRAAVGQLTKTRNRIANGVCPCCKRTFPNVADHMASKHPGYQEPAAQ